MEENQIFGHVLTRLTFKIAVLSKRKSHSAGGNLGKSFGVSKKRNQGMGTGRGSKLKNLCARCMPPGGFLLNKKKKLWEISCMMEIRDHSQTSSSRMSQECKEGEQRTEGRIFERRQLL